MRLLQVVLMVVVLTSGCVSVTEDTEPSDGDGDPTTTSTGPASTSTQSSSSNPSTAPQPPEPTLFVLLERGFSHNRTGGSGHGPLLAIGSHCGGADWSLDPPSVTVLDWSPRSSGTGGPTSSTTPTSGSSGTTTSGPDPDPWAPSGILVTSIRQAWIGNGSYSTTGHGPSAAGFDADAGTFEVRQAFGPAGVLSTLSTSDGEVRIDGQVLPAGANVTVRVAYTFTESYGDPPTSYAVEERLVFTNAGLATVASRNMGNSCI